ncbi:helix-turn-helix domain-containing protein [Gordonia crocea]|uniref:AraC family transcriptional regulator n=1 Tax=Gordonia crocea TaxID=589162 RepID=A0A7I9UZ72_9ACTN|nr:helix-turn-helix domain-containing protein [Gordonia crocea]GED98477.1 AraC family transcriptional regulator [Gordonia crocea]
MAVDRSRGILYPTKLPALTRLDPPARAADLVDWFWIPEWDIPAGRTSRQDIVAYPASNLVVEPDGCGLSGPTTRLSYRDLSGSGWAVGALLRPAAVGALTAGPGGLVDGYTSFEAPQLAQTVCTAMTGGPAGQRHARAVEAFTDWLANRVGAPSADALLANAMVRLLMTDSTVTRLDDAAAALAASPRTLQRLARRYVGLSPAAIIRRRRLQEAAQQIRDDPAVDLSAIAADLGYSDHAHLTNDFHAVLGFTPSSYRRASHTPNEN